MKRLSLLVLLLTTACGRSGPGAPGGAAPEESGPFSVILFIGDGTGISYWSAARLVSEDLSIQHFPVVGLVDTRSADSRVTDSAAGATAYASGTRTYNGALGVDPDTVPVQTVLEVAESEGMGTGLVATATVTHATPAAFAAHVPSRNMHWQIAAQMAEQGIDVLMGGGRRFFTATERPDSQDLLARLTRGGAYVATPEELQALDMDTVETLVGLFADNNPGTATERKPSLPEMTYAALRVLEKQSKGFFLMVEGSQIDWRGHENAPLEQVIAEVQDFDMAVRQGLTFQERHPNTLVVVLADHTTGGLALHPDEMGVFRAHYTTEGHTAEMVPLFARGPAAEQFAGVLDNEQVGRLLLELVADGGAMALRPHATTSTGAPWTPSSH